jgi:hypothetical protein
MAEIQKKRIQSKVVQLRFSNFRLVVPSARLERDTDCLLPTNQQWLLLRTQTNLNQFLLKHDISHDHGKSTEQQDALSISATS